MYGSSKPKVAVVDLEFDLANPDLASSTFRVTESNKRFHFLEELSRDPSFKLSHGTAVAGILAAEGDNAFGISGMLWDAELILFLRHA